MKDSLTFKFGAIEKPLRVFEACTEKRFSFAVESTTVPWNAELFDCPTEFKEKYRSTLASLKDQKAMFDNPICALKGLVSTREGEMEAPKLLLSFCSERTYFHHKSMQAVWQSLTNPNEVRILTLCRRLNRSRV